MKKIQPNTRGTRTKMEESVRASNRAIIRHVCKATGLPKREVEQWLNVLIVALHERLAAGLPTALYRIGNWKFYKRVGRTTTWPAKPGVRIQGITRTTPDIRCIKFTPSKLLSAKYRTLKPNEKP